MQPIIFYTSTELQLIKTLITQQIEGWDAQWFNAIENVLTVDVSNLEQLSEDALPSYTENRKLHIFSKSIHAETLSKALSNVDDFLEPSLSEAVFEKSLTALQKELSAALDDKITLYPLDDAKLDKKDCTGRGIVQVCIEHHLFHLAFIVQPKKLRKSKVAVSSDLCLDKSSINDLPCQIEAVLGESTISLEDIYLLKVGDVIKLDQTLKNLIVLKSDDKEIARASLCAMDKHYALRINPNN